MSLTLFSANLLETATVTSSPAGAVARLYDRDRGPQYQAETAGMDLFDFVPLSLVSMQAAATITIDVDLGSAKAVTAWAVLNHNITGVAITLYGDNSAPATTQRDTVSPAGADFWRSIASLSLRYWRLRVTAMAEPLRIGEVLLGVPRTVVQNPTLPRGLEHPLANVTSDRSPGGYRWAARKGSKRMAYRVAWSGLDATDSATLAAAYDDCDQGAKNLLLTLPDGTLRWSSWLELGAPDARGNGRRDVAALFEEAL